MAVSRNGMRSDAQFWRRTVCQRSDPRMSVCRGRTRLLLALGSTAGRCLAADVPLVPVCRRFAGRAVGFCSRSTEAGQPPARVDHRGEVGVWGSKPRVDSLPDGRISAGLSRPPPNKPFSLRAALPNPHRPKGQSEGPLGGLYFSESARTPAGRRERPAHRQAAARPVHRRRRRSVRARRRGCGNPASC